MGKISVSYGAEIMISPILNRILEPLNLDIKPVRLVIHILHAIWDMSDYPFLKFWS